jgi:hypothetical protein
MKRLESILFMVMVLVLALTSAAGAADVVYNLTAGDCNDAAAKHGTNGTNGTYLACTGDVYNASDELVGHFYMILNILSPYTFANGNQTFQTIHMVELASGGPPWYNFTLQGSYAYGMGIGYGAITNITEFPGSLTGAYYTTEYNAAPGYNWTITLHLP